MNRSKIEWCDHTWNPVTGCLHGCEYCYARTMTARFAGDVRLNKMAKADYEMRPAADGNGNIYVLEKPMMNETGSPLVYPFGFEPTFHRYRMNTLDKLKMGNNIFVGAMADIFGSWVPDEWIKQILDVCKKYPIHNFLFLTKNPQRYKEYGVPTAKDNLWYGTTITCDADADRISSLMNIDAKTFVSIEPLKGSINKENIETICDIADWIIIGAETGRGKNKVRPRLDWINSITLAADAAGVPVFMKNSLAQFVSEENMQREFPEQLRRSKLSPKMREKLYDICYRCNNQMRKSEMITLLARSKRGEQPKQFAFMCKKCFIEFCDGLGVDLPKLEALSGNQTVDLEKVKR